VDQSAKASLLKFDRRVVLPWFLALLPFRRPPLTRLQSLLLT